MKKLLLSLIVPFLSFGQDLEIYKVIRTIETVEIREYTPLLFASYFNKIGEADPNSSFRVLANYIFGSNETSEEIGMTSPVVINLSDDAEMLFIMPANYNMENIPKPNNVNIKFLETDYTHKAVIKFSGYTNAEKENKKITELKKILHKHGIQHNNKFELFVYDPPYKFLNRRNEICVNILKNGSKPTLPNRY